MAWNEVYQIAPRTLGRKTLVFLLSDSLLEIGSRHSAIPVVMIYLCWTGSSGCDMSLEAYLWHCRILSVLETSNK